MSLKDISLDVSTAQIKVKKSALGPPHLRFGDASSHIPVHQWADLHPVFPLPVSLPEELFCQGVHPSSVHSLGCSKVAKIGAFEGNLKSQ